MPRHSRKIAAAVLPTLALSCLTPVQQGAVIIAASTATLSSTPALAQQTGIPGVGLVVKKKPGNAPIIIPGDANGEVRLIGLEPGDYEIEPLRLTAAAPVRNTSITKVGPDGKLAFVILQGDAPQAKAGLKKCVGRKLAARLCGEADGLQIEQIAFDGPGGKLPDNAVVLNYRQAFTISPPIPCAPPRPGMVSNCPGRIRSFIDVNASPEAEMIRLAPTLSPEAAKIIAAERARKPFSGLGDFARRVCSRVAVDFDDAAVQMGSTSILLKRGGNPKDPGWKCHPGGGVGDLPEVNVFGGPILITFWLKWL